MQKTLAFLEQNVQWLALGLAAVFFGLCVWWYVLTPPAAVTKAALSKEPITPQNVDEMIKSGPVQDISRSRDSVTELAINVPDVVKPWQTRMNAVNAPALAATYSRPLYDPKQAFGTTDTNIAELNAGGVVKDLPLLPKAVPQNPTAGLSVVSTPAQPGQGGAQPAAAGNFDLEWATVSATIPAKDVQAAFDKIQKELDQKLAAINRPSIKLTTDVLRVELQRQRGSMGPNGPVFPNGDQGVESIPTPKYLEKDIHPLPDPKAQLLEKVTYYEWAEKNPELVCQPKFYDVHGGSPWVAPVLAGAAPAPGAPAPAPAPGARGLAGIPPAMPPRGAVPAQPAPGGPGGVGGAGGPGGLNQAPGQLNPATLTQDILVWNHDDTVRPGQTYRYRIVYYMKNPVLGLTGVADKSILEVLEVKSPPSDWSAPVTIPQVTKFWFASLRGSGAAADVYHWENGVWTRKQGVLYQPGDKVADSEWTVVDVHGQYGGARDREKYVILTNDAGEVIRRYPSADRSNDEKKGLDAQVNPGAAAAGGNPTMPPPNAPARTPAVAPGGRAGVMPRGG